MIVKVAGVGAEGPVTLPVKKVRPPVFALLIVLDASTFITRAELNAVVPVTFKVAPFRLITLLALPKFAVAATDKVPEVTEVAPV